MVLFQETIAELLTLPFYLKVKTARALATMQMVLFPSDKDDGAEVLGCKVADDLSQPLGNPNERMLATALHYIKNNECSSNPLQVNDDEKNPLSEIRGRMLRNYPETMILR